MWMPRMTKTESDKQKALEQSAKDLFETAKPFLEAAHAINEGDLETMRSLRDIYARTGDDDKMLELTAKIKAASN